MRLPGRGMSDECNKPGGTCGGLSKPDFLRLKAGNDVSIEGAATITIYEKGGRRPRSNTRHLMMPCHFE
jgi:hypothetical protein